MLLAVALIAEVNHVRLLVVQRAQEIIVALCAVMDVYRTVMLDVKVNVLVHVVVAVVGNVLLTVVLPVVEDV